MASGTDLRYRLGLPYMLEDEETNTDVEKNMLLEIHHWSTEYCNKNQGQKVKRIIEIKPNDCQWCISRNVFKGQAVIPI